MNTEHDPVTRGEMTQFEKRMEEANTTLREDIRDLTSAVNDIAVISRDTITEYKLLREELVGVVRDQSKNHYILKDQVNDIEHRITQDEQANRESFKEVREDLKFLNKLDNRLEKLEAAYDSKIDWGKWGSRLILSSLVATLFSASVGIILHWK